MSTWNDFAATAINLDGALQGTTTQTFSVVFSREKAGGQMIQDLASAFVRNGGRVYAGVVGQSGVQVDARTLSFSSILSILETYKPAIASIGFFDPAVLGRAKGYLSYSVDPEGKASGFYP